MKRKTKNTLKTIALAVVGLGAIVGAASLVGNLVEKQDEELKVIHPMFEVGGLTADGKYEESDKTIYTKEAFECQGLEIKLEFDNTIDYQVFYYEDDGDFLSASEVINGNQDLVVPNNATHARIEITQNWDEMGEDYVKEKDQVIKWYEVSKYASQMELKVNKEQLTYLERIEQGEDVFTLMGQGMFDMDTDEFSSNTTSPWYFSGIIDCSSAEEIIIKLPTTELSRKVTYSGSERNAINKYDLTNDTDLKFDGSTANVIGADGKYSYISVNCENFDSFVFSTSVNAVEDVAVYLV